MKRISVFLVMLLACLVGSVWFRANGFKLLWEASNNYLHGRYPATEVGGVVSNIRDFLRDDPKATLHEAVAFTVDGFVDDDWL